MSVTSIKDLFAPALVAGLLLSGCAASQTAQPMAGMGGGGMKMEQEPHMMMQALGCAHAPMDMAAMKTMTPEQHQAMMGKHVAECRAKLLADGAEQARDHFKSCMSSSMTSKRFRRDQVEAMVGECTSSPMSIPGKTPSPAPTPAHNH